MAQVHLLSTPRPSEDLSRASTEEGSASFDFDPVEYKLDQREYSSLHTQSDSRSRSRSAFQNKRSLCIGLGAFLCVFIPCLLLLLASGQFQSKHTKHKHIRTHRGMACTTWPQDKITEAARQWSPSPKWSSTNQSIRTTWKKPENIRIIGLVFYGRREFVDILDCYLRRNLASEGGYLDEVHFVANTHVKEDLNYLDNLVETAEEYKRMEIPERCKSASTWACLWDSVTDPNAIYIKIDDDVLYLHHDAIPSIVDTRVRYKNAFAIGGNIVNIVNTGWMYYHNGAVHPYLPEPNASEVRNPSITWRPSEMPEYPSSDDVEMIRKKKIVKEMEPPFRGHRWLRLRSGSASDLKKTPIGKIEDNDPDISRHWSVAAQQQYSLLENLEHPELLDKYRIGDSDGIWNSQFRRYNINLVAVWGSDILDNSPFQDGPMAYDEKLISQLLPLQTGRPYLVQSRALALHYSFNSQRRGMTTTDLLDRWRAYANENVCHEFKRPFGKPCAGVDENAVSTSA